MEIKDLLFVINRTGINQPVRVRVIHSPSGHSASAINHSEYVARNEATAELKKKVQENP